MPPQARTLSLAPGDDLPTVIAERAVALGPDAWAQAVGHVEAVELRIASEGADPVRSLRGRFTLVSLAGPARGPLSATLARATDAGLELLGGQLVRARSAGVTVLLTPSASLDEAAASPENNRPAVRPEPRGPSASAPPGPAATPARPAPPAPAATPPPAAVAAVATAPAPPAAAPAAPAAAAPTTSWGQVAQASERAVDEAEEEDDEIPSPGDLVDHFSFGLCEVLTSDGERLRIRDLRGPGRVREISLNMLSVARPTTSNNKRLYRLLRK